ncbi:hypothetical protein Dsin_001625 [Dipteronia sinensis]|uniref:Ubiquitin-like protease family profile domain-containing protein n=1 Tax=Dipteronia sinensis TaxID=43782 RepID=A0AAE0B5Z6_9ROSI|nr:hypothetical protein Dsin_001625 [Dipteronia sinensis]
MRKREKGREEKPSLPLAVAAASTFVAVAAAHRRIKYFLPSLQNERERKRRDRYVAVAVSRHRSPPVAPLSESMENINYADFLIKLRSSWIKKSTTNLYCNLNGLPDIVKVLQKVGELQELRKTCFGHLLGFPKELTFSAGVLHNLLLRQIHVPGVTGANELHFLVGGELAKFSQREFCLVTGLQFGVMSDIFLKPYAATKDGIHVRYFENDENIRLTDVWARFMAGEFYQPKDGLKMALVLIANNLLFGQDLRRKATLWLFQMVEDLEAFNSFPWGSYVYMMTIHYLRQGFRSANAPLKHIAHYNLYGFPWALEHVMLEELHPTDDEKTQPYLVGVDIDLAEGPQFIALNVELDDGEKQPNVDVNDDGNEDGNDSSNDGSQSRPQQNKKKPVKRKVSPHNKKWQQGPKGNVGDDSTDSSRLMREVMSAMSDRFEDIVKKEIKKEISAMEGRLNARLTSVEASLAQLVNQRRQTTPEVHDFSTPVHQHFESHRVQTTPEVQGDYVGSPNVGGDGTVGKGVGEGDATPSEGIVGGDATPSEGIVGGDATHSEELQIVVHNSLLPEEMVVQTLPLYEDDTTMLEYIAVKNEREQRLKITSRYMNSPNIDPFQEPDKEKQKLKTNYSRFKRSRKDTVLNVGTDYYATKQFFVEMESPTCWLSNVLLVPCAVGDPDGHWILCVIDLEKRTVCIYDPLHRQKKIATRRKQITPLLRFIPVILQESGYYQQKGIQPNGTMFTVQQSILKKLPTQLDNDSCGVFICRYTDMLMRHKCFWGWGTKNVPWFREEMALEIFANSVASD